MCSSGYSMHQPGDSGAAGARPGGSGALANTGLVGGDRGLAGVSRSVCRKGGRRGYDGGGGPCTAVDAHVAGAAGDARGGTAARIFLGGRADESCAYAGHKLHL
jgi:hypothetical protein